jgi:hypothetical protein
MPEFWGMAKPANSNPAQAGAPPTSPQPAVNRREFLATIQPAFIRLPRAGQRDPLTGLTRTHLFGLIKTKKVRSVALKQQGCKRGVRLIDAQSLLAAINSEA